MKTTKRKLKNPPSPRRGNVGRPRIWGDEYEYIQNLSPGEWAEFELPDEVAARRLESSLRAARFRLEDKTFVGSIYRDGNVVQAERA